MDESQVKCKKLQDTLDKSQALSRDLDAKIAVHKGDGMPAYMQADRAYRTEHGHGRRADDDQSMPDSASVSESITTASEYSAVFT